MNMQVNINNFRKIQQAYLEIEPIAFLVGENENGKSSIAQAVALAATGQVLPKGMAKKEAKSLVHDGAKSGKVSISRDGLTSQISWPLCEHNELGQGKPIYSSEFAVGLKNIFQLSSSEKSTYFINLLKANPTMDDLKLVLPKSMDVKLPEIWKQIEESGWDEAHASAKKEESEFTGRWKQETGESSWNVSKAGNWRPEDWEPDLERSEREELEIIYAEAQKNFEAVLKAEGAAEFANDDEGLPCPECGVHLTYSDGKLEKASDSKSEKKTAKSKNIVDVQEAKDQLAYAEQRLDSFNKVQKASALYGQILTQKELVTALSQNGVRKKKLDEQLERFNDEVLNPLCIKCNWENVWIDEELRVWRGDRPYQLISRSARYVTRIILQLAIAIADRSELLVIDDLDEVNDRQNRGHLLTTIISTAIPALICMAKRPDENAPDLSAGGDGKTYLVKNGIVELFTQSAEVKAA